MEGRKNLRLAVEVEPKANLDHVIDSVRRALIIHALRAEGWNQTHAAKRLGRCREWLWREIQALGLQAPKNPVPTEVDRPLLVRVKARKAMLHKWRKGKKVVRRRRRKARRAA